MSAAYNRIYFPSAAEDLDDRELLVPVTIDNGLKLGTGGQSAETQIEALLVSSTADYKLAIDLEESSSQYFAMAEKYLWPSGKDNRRTPWKDVVSRAKSYSVWPWMPGAGGMDTLKAAAIKQGRWRLGEDGYIEKGPFPPEKATVNVSLVSTDQEIGESTLSLTPRYAGDGPVVYYASRPDDLEPRNEVENLETATQVENIENFTTSEATLYFVAKDPTGEFESAPPVRWLASLKIKHDVSPAVDKRRVTLQCTPKAAMFFSIDGTTPKNGTRYESPFEIDSAEKRLLVYAESGEANARRDFNIPASTDKTVRIDDTKPARLQAKRVTLDTPDRVFGVINHFRDQKETLFKGVRIELGEGENTVAIRFNEREVTASVMDGVVEALRQVLQEDQAPVTIMITDGIRFDTGFELKEFARIAGIQLRPGDVIQDE